MTNKLETIQLQYMKRNAKQRGPTSSEQYNDLIDETAADLTALNSQWNDRLVPLTSAIPNGIDDVTVDAYLNGLDGKNLYVDASATLLLTPLYFNSAASRPNTIFEQLDNIYTVITALEEDLENQINNVFFTAAQVAIDDSAGLYIASNVEDALAEVKNAVNAISLGVIDLTAVTTNIVPSVDNTLDLGTSLLRWRDLYLGPASLHIVRNQSADGGAAPDKDYGFSIDSTSGKMELIDDPDGSPTTIAAFDTTGLELSTPLTNVTLDTTARDALTPAQGMFIFNTTDTEFQGYDGTAWGVIGGGGGGGTNTTANVLTLGADSDNDEATSHILFNVDGSEQARLDDSGFLGIGITPTSKLHVQDNAGNITIKAVSLASGDFSANLRVQNDAGSILDTAVLTSTHAGTYGGISRTGAAILFSSATKLFIHTGNSAPIHFNTNNINALNIDTSQNVTLAQTTAQLLLPFSNDAVTPTLAFGDGDTGIYEFQDDFIRFAMGGVASWTFSSTAITGVIVGSPGIQNEAASGTNPTLLPDSSDPDTGIGTAGTDQLSIIAGGLEGFRLTETGSAVDVQLMQTTSQLLLPLSNDAVTPTLAFGDGDTGFYESVDDTLNISIAGASSYLFSSTGISTAAANGPHMLNETPSNTNPVWSFFIDNDTGIGSGALDRLSLIAGGVEIVRLQEAVTGTGMSFRVGSVAIGAAVTTFAVDGNVMNVTAAAAETIATITGATTGMILTMLFDNANVTITDNNTHAANTIDLNAAFTSADDTILQLVFNGGAWYEISRSVN